jgi:nucleotide-binding universal stress UspA family protein
MFRNIVVCTDLTSVSLVALRMAVKLACDNGASLTALHVVPLPPAIRHWSAPVFRSDVKVYRELLDRQLEAHNLELRRQLVAAGAGELEIRCLVRAGLPAEVIATTADELGADLIVVARGRGGQLGSTTAHTVRLAGRTVLVAPAKEPETLRVGARGGAAKGTVPGRRHAAARAA